MNFVISPPQQVSIPVVGTDDFFPVRRIYCIGRNYAAHAVEMGHDPDREPPFFFCKPADAIRVASVGQTLEIPYPPKTSNLHYEVEMVVGLAKGGSNIKVEDALKHVYGYAVGLDLTRRDIQQGLKDLARPWELAKAFDASAPISAMVQAENVDDVNSLDIKLSVNNVLKQNGNTKQMIWSVAESISYLSEYFCLEPGDLIFTGTPEGVGPVQAGDYLTVSLDNVSTFEVLIK